MKHNLRPILCATPCDRHIRDDPERTLTTNPGPGQGASRTRTECRVMTRFRAADGSYVDTRRDGEGIRRVRSRPDRC